MLLRELAIAGTALLGLCSSSFSQEPGQAHRFPGYPGRYTESGLKNGVYGVSIGGFGNYGLPGSSPGYQGYALSGYGPGASAEDYFGYASSTLVKKAKTSTKPMMVSPGSKPSSSKPKARTNETRRPPVR